MSACEQVQPLLAEWIGGELDETDVAIVRAHLPACSACRADEAEMRSVLALLHADPSGDGLSDVADPGDAYWAGFAPRVRAALPAKVPRRAATRPEAEGRRWGSRGEAPGNHIVRLRPRARGLVVATLAAAALVVLALRMPLPPSAADADARLAEILASPAAEGLADVLAPPSSEALAALDPEDLDRLGEQLAAGPVVEESAGVEDLDELSPELLEKFLERLDAT